MKLTDTQGEILKAGCVIMNDDGEVLLVTIPGRDVWAWPKGHMEEGETVEAAAKREVLEETGYEVEIVRQLSDLVHVKDSVHNSAHDTANNVYKNANKNKDSVIRIHMFLVNPIKKISDGEEGIIKRWFSIEEAKAKLFPNLISILEEVEV